MSSNDEAAREAARNKADRYIGRDGGSPVEPEITPDEALALEAVGYASTMAANDPNWQAEMAELKRDVDNIASNTSRVTLVDRGPRGSHVEVTLAEPRNRPEAMRTASTMARVFEAELAVDRQGPGPGASQAHGGDGPSYRQPPRHTHYKDDRRG